MAAPQQHEPLRHLQQLLEPLDLNHVVDTHVLHPGQRREQLLRGLLARLLGGLAVEEVCFGCAEELEGLAADERFAEKCRALLLLLGIRATTEQLRGCSGDTALDTAPLLEMARLLQAVEQQRAGTQRSQQQQQEAGGAVPAAAASSSISALLTSAVGSLSKLASDSMQLFPSDMTDTLRAYSDQGALLQLPQLCHTSVSRAQQLQQRLRALLDAGGSSCEGAGSAQWQALLGEASGSLDALLADMRAFDDMYEQELSVWANCSAGEQQQRQAAAHGVADGGAATAAAASAEATGRMARSLVAAFQQLTGLVAAFAGIRAQHAALKDVPVAGLAEQRGRLHSDTNKLRVQAAALSS